MSRRRFAGRRGLWLGGVLALGAAALWWHVGGRGTTDSAPTPDTAAAAGATGVAGATVAAAAAPLTAASAAMLAAVHPPMAAAASAVPARAPGKTVSVDELRTTGALRGTELDGDWGAFAGGVLKPGLRLRQRFDHLLIGIGDVDAADLRNWIAAQASAAHGDQGAAQVLAVYDAYVKLLRSEVGGQAPSPADPQAWQRWIAQRSAARTAALGPAWSQAFYAEEERDLQAFGERMAQRAAAPRGAVEPEEAAQKALLPTSAVLEPKAEAVRHAQRVQYFGAEGARRLAEEDKAWAAWDQRIQAARQRQAAIAADTQLSPQQRQQALEADLARHFQGTELFRAQGLIRP